MNNLSTCGFSSWNFNTFCSLWCHINHLFALWVLKCLDGLSKLVYRAQYLGGMEKLVPETCDRWRNKVGRLIKSGMLSLVPWRYGEIGLWQMVEWHGGWWKEVGGWSKAVCWACYLDGMEKLAPKTCDGWQNVVMDGGMWWWMVEWHGGWQKQLGINIGGMGWWMVEWCGEAD